MTGTEASDTAPISVAVFGASGKMGTIACEAIEADERLTLVARLGRDTARDEASGAHVIVDLTHPESVRGNLEWAIANGKHAVVGTTGMSADDTAAVEGALADADGLGVLLIPNFSIGAYLARKFAAIASTYYDAAEVIEYSHTRKAEAPSGTAVSAAQEMSRVRDGEPWPSTPNPHDESGARGLLVEGTPVHSVRLPGLVNRQEVILAGPSELVTVKYETMDRWAFMPGLIEAIVRVGGMPGIHRGLESIYDD